VTSSLVQEGATFVFAGDSSTLKGLPTINGELGFIGSLIMEKNSGIQVNGTVSASGNLTISRSLRQSLQQHF
jgi:hypothetical protein